MGLIDYLHAIYENRMRNIEVEDIGVAALRFKNDALGLILGSVDLRPQEHWVAIYGSKKSVIMSEAKITREWEEARALRA
jgi:predicted dehydrogenase